jgi:hypothetical protein
MAEISYGKLLNEIKPSLEALGELVYGNETPISHLINIAENLELIESKSKVFWGLREKVLNSLAEKDENGDVKTKTKGENTEIVISEKNKIIWHKKFQELLNEKVKIDLKKIQKKYLEGAKVTPNQLKGCFILLE